MPVVEILRDIDGLPYRIILNHLKLWGVERGPWERWPTRKVETIDLSAWVDRHCTPRPTEAHRKEGA